jgi:toxin ParE1/3/4
MNKIIISPLAQSDFDNIFDFLGQNDRKLATDFARNVMKICERILKFLESGRIVPEFENSKIREVLWKYYRIIYRIRASHLELITIHHTSRRFNNNAIKKYTK